MPYTARASATIGVEISLDGVQQDAPPLGGSWTVTAADPFDASDYTENGTGDGVLTGDVVHGREYQIAFQYEEGYITPTAANIVADSGTPRFFIGNYESTAPAVGTVTVTTQTGANWILTGTLGYTSGTRTGTQSLTSLPYDTYTVTFEDNLIQYTSPAPDVGVLDSATLGLSGTYVSRSSAGSFNVNVQRNGIDPGTWGGWTVTSDAPFTGDFTDTGTGDNSVAGSIYEGRGYTCVWDAEVGYSTPTPVARTATTGVQQFFGNYESAEAGDITITVTGVSAPDVAATTWTLVYEPNGTETPGTGNDVLHDMPLGDYHVRWGWLRDYWTYRGFDSRSHPQGVGPNGPWTGPTQELKTGESLTFNDPYTSRGVQSKTARRMGMSAVSDTYYGGGQALSNWMGYVRSNVPTTPGWPNLNPTGNSEARVQCHAPLGKVGPQPFWLFWRGKGTMSVGTGDLDGSDLNDFYCNGDAAGQAGHRFILNVDQTPGDTLVNTPELGNLDKPAQGYIKATNIDGADPLRDIEIVHADYCNDDGNDKSFRSVDPATGNFVSTNMKYYFANQSVVRFLDHTNRVNYPEKDFVYGRGSDWESTKGNGGYTLNTAGRGREADSKSTGECHTVLQCYQQQIDIANALDVDLWICTPTWDNPDLEQAIIDAIEAPYTGLAASQGDPSVTGCGLRSTLKVYFEYSNETWNGGSYRAQQYCEEMGKRKAGISPVGPASQGYQDIKDQWSYFGNNEQYVAHRYTTDRLCRFAQRYKATVASKGEGYFASRCRPILAAQAGSGTCWPYLRSRVVGVPNWRDFPVVSFDGSTNALDHIDYWSVAYYWDYKLAPSAPSNYESAYQAWYPNWKNELDNKWAGKAITAYNNAQDNGLNLIAYEGGGGHMGLNATVAGVSDEQYWYYAQRHMNSYKVTLDAYDTLEPYFDVFCEFGAPSVWTAKWGCWGVMEAFTPIETAWRWHALVDYSHMNPRT